MRQITPSIRTSLLLQFIVILLMSPFYAAAQNKPVPARIVRAVDDTQLVQLKGNVHPLARAEFDRGMAPDDLPMKRMLLILQRSAEQESSLQQMMSEQYDKSSPNFHKWITPEEFGRQFGPADSDIEAVTSWLTKQGFQVAKVSKGKLAIEFSGTAGQLRSAFHTEIHKFVVNGESHWANANEPQMPAALAPVITGFASLHDFRPKPMHHVAGTFQKPITSGKVTEVKPELTNGGEFFISPDDFATIYNIQGLYSATPAAIDGTGQSIAVIGVSNINLQDVRDFRTVMGLPSNDPTIIIDGSDPGIRTNGSELEAALDVEWSGAVAKNAQIHFVIAESTNDASGLLLAILHVIDSNSDPVMSLSFGTCESGLGTNGNNTFNNLWTQAAAQGITVVVSSGDTGSAGCEDQNIPAPNPATTGLQVSGFASTPFNVAVGGTDFNDHGNQTTYFNTTNNAKQGSAKGYIPEITWNDSCTNSAFGSNPEANCNSSVQANKNAVFTVAGSGGASIVYAKPSFQQLITAAHGMPADNKRDIPDISLFASDGFNLSSYVVCDAATQDSTKRCLQGSNFSFSGVGGTSVSTPAFAGIMALINQNELAHGRSGRQGNANFVLYELAKQQFTAGTACASIASPLPASTCTFNDVQSGTISMPCTGSLNCTKTVGSDTYGVLAGYNAGPGYDLATGLGSVNVANLVANWQAGLTALTASTTTLTLNNGTAVNVMHGTAVPVTISVSPSSATGNVALVSTAATGAGVDGFTLGAGGTVTGTTDQLTGGSYTVKAHYPGDGVVGPSDSNTVNVTVTPQGSLTTANVLDPGGNGIVVTGGTSPLSVILRADVTDSGSLNHWTATGTVTFVDTSMTPATPLASNINVNSQSAAVTNPITLFGGTHKIVAQYNGDPSFSPSNSAAVTVTVTGAKAGITSATLTANPTTIALNGNVNFTYTVVGAAGGPAPSGTVSYSGGGASGTATLSATTSNSSTATFSASLTVGGSQTITATYAGDAQYGAAPNATAAVTVTGGGPAAFTIAGTAATVSAGGTGTSTITVTPTNSIAPGTVNITCGSLPPGVSCTPSPLAINASSATNPTTGTLTISVAAPSTSMTASVRDAQPIITASNPPSSQTTGNDWWGVSAGTGLAACFLLCWPGRKKYRAALGLGLLCVFSFALGCGGGSSGGGGGTPASTTTTLTVSSTKVPSTGSITVTAKVTSTGASPTGNVQFFDGSTPLGAAAQLTNGTFSQTLTSANAPVNVIGTHAISVRYLGDTNTSASTSGTLNITVTGSTTVAISSSPAASNSPASINLTIN